MYGFLRCETYKSLQVISHEFAVAGELVGSCSSLELLQDKSKNSVQEAS